MEPELEYMAEEPWERWKVQKQKFQACWRTEQRKGRVPVLRQYARILAAIAIYYVTSGWTGCPTRDPQEGGCKGRGCGETGRVIDSGRRYQLEGSTETVECHPEDQDEDLEERTVASTQGGPDAKLHGEDEVTCTSGKRTPQAGDRRDQQGALGSSQGLGESQDRARYRERRTHGALVGGCSSRRRTRSCGRQQTSTSRASEGQTDCRRSKPDGLPHEGSIRECHGTHGAVCTHRNFSRALGNIGWQRPGGPGGGFGGQAAPHQERHGAIRCDQVYEDPTRRALLPRKRTGYDKDRSKDGSDVLRKSDRSICRLDVDDERNEDFTWASGDGSVTEHPTTHRKIRSLLQENRLVIVSGSPEQKHGACREQLENRHCASGSPVCSDNFDCKICWNFTVRSCMHTDSNRSDNGATQSEDSSASPSRVEQSEPDPEGQGEDDEIQALIDVENLPSLSTDTSKAVFYRPNIFGRLQRLHCDILLDGHEIQRSLARGLLECWPIDLLQFRARFLLVHDAIHRSDSHRNGQVIFIVDVGIDRSASFEQESTILLEIQTITEATWLTTTTRALYVPWRCTMRQLLDYVRHQGLCDDERCFVQHNGNFVPMDSLLTILDGDLLQIQIHRSDTTVMVDGRHRLNRSNVDSDSCTDSEPHHETKTAVDVEVDYAITSVVTYRTGTDRGMRKFVAYQLLGHDPLTVVHNHLASYWHDVDRYPWKLQEVHASYRSSLWLRHWQRVNILEFDHDRSPDFITVMFEFIAQGPPELRSHQNFALWVPTVVTREFLLRINERPQSSASRCRYRLAINDIPIDDTTEEEIRLEPGAFIRITSDPSLSVLRQGQYTSRSSRCGRKTYGDSLLNARKVKGCTLITWEQIPGRNNKTHATSAEGCTSSTQLAHLCNIFIYLLWLQKIGAGTIGICKFLLFVVQKLLFLNYDRSKTTTGGEFLWQTSRLLSIAVGIPAESFRQKFLMVPPKVDFYRPTSEFQSRSQHAAFFQY